MKIWIEVYHDGVLNKDRTAEFDCEAEGAGMLVYDICDNPKEDGSTDRENFVLGVYNEDGGSGQTVTFPAEEDNSSGVSYDSNDNAKIEDGKKIVLESVRENNDEDYEALPNSFFTDYENNLDLIKNDTVTYLFCCEFYK